LRTTNKPAVAGSVDSDRADRNRGLREASADDPSKYHDTFEDNVKKLIRARLEGKGSPRWRNRASSPKWSIGWSRRRSRPRSALTARPELTRPVLNTEARDPAKLTLVIGNKD